MSRSIRLLAPYIIASIVTAVVVVGMYMYVRNNNDVADQSVAFVVSSSTSAVPKRLLIPKLHVDANVQSTGRTRAGAMGTPTNFKDVAWFALGPRPGEEGSAVIDGHVDNALSLAGVFKHLSELQIGDSVTVLTTEGDESIFRVIAAETYPYNKVPLDLLFDKKGGRYLNLVTCAGVWLQKQKTYSERLVVYTELRH